MLESKKKILVFVGGLIVLVLIIFLGYYLNKNSGLNLTKKNLNLKESVKNIDLEKIKKEEIEIETPEENSTDLPKNVAKPVDVINLSGPQNSVAIRTFEIKAEDSGFNPSVIVVNDNDIVTIKLTAIDGDYDVFIPNFGIYLSSKKGETKQTQFQVYGVGKYDFFCKNCNNQDNLKGVLVVNQK